MDHVRVPVRLVNNARWGALAYLGETHEICAEKGDCIDQKFSFAGQHRVRLWRFRKNVHWKIPTGVDLDISGVQRAAPPRRR
jgi:hypothetical protein